MEIFGPVVVLMTFRTPAEAVELANNTRYGLAASVWTENINLALDIAPQLKAGTVWINCTNVFDAASGFGGYRESGFGREGGREGLREYVKWEDGRTGGRSDGRTAAGGRQPGASDERAEHAGPRDRRVRPSDRPTALPPIDRTPKLYIGGKQVRPDSGYSLPVLDAAGERIGEVGHGNRKDIRNAVEAAHKAAGWARATAHNRAQVLYYIAENLAARARSSPSAQRSFGRRVAGASARWRSPSSGSTPTPRGRTSTTGWCTTRPYPQRHARDARADRRDRRRLPRRLRRCSGSSRRCSPRDRDGQHRGRGPVRARLPLAATDFYQVLDTSDVPGGVVNIVTGLRDELAPVLAAHDDVDGIWYFGTRGGCGGGGAARRGQHEAHLGGLRP